MTTRVFLLVDFGTGPRVVRSSSRWQGEPRRYHWHDAAEAEDYARRVLCSPHNGINWVQPRAWWLVEAGSAEAARLVIQHLADGNGFSTGARDGEPVGHSHSACSHGRLLASGGQS